MPPSKKPATQRTKKSRAAASRTPRSAGTPQKSIAANVSATAASVEKQMDSFIAKFAPAIAQQLRACRAILRTRFPTAVELVYDNYNFFVIGYCSAPRSSDCIVSLVANSKGLGLSFYWGATVPDPHRLLQGSGTQNRFVRLPTPATLTDPKVSALIAAATAQAKIPLPSTGPAITIIKSISAKQRPRI
jgi:hypothetical protein